jgi:hypothetical protein
MLKKFVLILALMPVLNLLHESGHWLGAKAIGADPKMLLQRVDVGADSRFSPLRRTVYNWGGPMVNYVAITASMINPWFLPVGFSMSCHRVAPNIFAAFLYFRGHSSFTTDETKQFSEESRLWVALLFSSVYLIVAFIVVSRWLPGLRIPFRIGALLSCAIIWFGYLILLDFFDKNIKTTAVKVSVACAEEDKGTLIPNS